MGVKMLLDEVGWLLCLDRFKTTLTDLKFTLQALDADDQTWRSVLGAQDIYKKWHGKTVEGAVSCGTHCDHDHGSARGELVGWAQDAVGGYLVVQNENRRVAVKSDSIVCRVKAACECGAAKIGCATHSTWCPVRT